MKLWGIALLLGMAACENAEERGARENAELDARIKERAQADAEVQARRTKAQEADEAASAKARAVAAQQRQLLVEQFRAYPKAGREDAMRRACADGCAADADSVALILDAASAEERDALRQLSVKLDREAKTRLRERFANGLDEVLLQRHLNPDSVQALGADKTLLYIQGWFCSRQFMYDFIHGESGKAAAGMGFTTLKCQGPAEWFQQGL